MSRLIAAVSGPGGQPGGGVDIGSLNDSISDQWNTGVGDNYYDLGTPGGFISAVFPYLFGIAGLILFVMLVWGSIEIFFGAADTKSADQGKKRITTAIIGFFLLFSVFWIAQIISTIFGIQIGLFSVGALFPAITPATP